MISAYVDTCVILVLTLFQDQRGDLSTSGAEVGLQHHSFLSHNPPGSSLLVFVSGLPIDY